MNFHTLDRLESNYQFKFKLFTYMRKRTFEYQDDEIESESHCLSSNSQTQSLHSGNSGRLSDLSSKKNEIDGTKLHSKKSNSSDAMKKGSNRRLDHRYFIILGN